MGRKEFIVIIVIFFTVSFINIDVESRDSEKTQIDQVLYEFPMDFTPIVIDGNDDLVNQSSTYNWTGNGTESYPYIIENLEIPSYSEFGLEIKNVDLHILIRNCTSKSEYMETGIYLDNSRNLTLKNISIDTRGSLIYCSRSSNIEMVDIVTGGRNIDYWGYFSSCDNLSISDSNLGDRASIYQCDSVILSRIHHGQGSFSVRETTNIILMNSTNSGTTQFRQCSEFVIKNCTHGDSTSYGFLIDKCFNGTFSDNNLTGYRGQIELVDSRDIKMYNNSLGREGLRITGEVSDLYSLEIPVNNTIDGQPIVMIKDNNLTSLEENPYPSQIIMINITTLKISGNDFKSDPKSIHIIQSYDVIFDNLTISNSSFGISILSSKNIHIENCNMENLYFGAINIENSDRISVENCVFSDIMDEYFKIIGSRDFSFKSLIITENNYGDIFEVRSSLNGTFRDIRINSGFAPFNIDHCESLRIEGCNISSYYGIRIEESEDIIVKKNRIKTKYNGIRVEDDENVIIVDNSIISESKSGVYQEYCHNIVYYSNKLDKCSFIFKCRPDDQLGVLLPSNNTVDGKPVLYMNRVNSRLINNDDIWGQIVIDEVSGYKVEDLTIVNKNYPFQVFSSLGFNIHNCSFVDTYSGIKTQNSESMRITSTRFDNTTLCINAESAGNLFIDKCSFHNVDTGILIWSRWSDDIKNTKILDCSFLESSNCIDVEDIQTVDVDRCSFKEGTRAISFRYGMKGYIRNCELTNISGYGFSLYRFSESIIDSNILINVSTGLITDRSNTQKVHDNLFAECSNQAIKSEYGYNEPNWFFNNIFINNNGAGDEFNSSHIQAYCENEKDFWNNSLKRGNYWSDWTGPDENNDGIVDQPYNLSGASNHDNFPLKEHPFKLIGSPINISGEVGNGFLMVNWNDPEWNRLNSITGFRIHRESSGEETRVFEVDGQTHTFNDTTIINEKKYTYRITSLNNYGESVLSESIDLVGDGTSPFFQTLSPENNTIFNRSQVNLNWEVMDDGTGIHDAWISLDAADWSRADSLTSHTLNNLTDGEHIASVRIMDRVGNHVERDAKFVVDTLPPVLDIWSDLEGVITNRTTVGINWSGEDLTTGIEYYMISINNGGWEYWGSKTGFTFNEIKTGNHSLKVMGVDSAGNDNRTTFQFRCDIDRPFIRFTSPNPGSLIEEDEVTFGWDLTDAGSGVKEVLFSLDDEDPYLISNTGTITISGVAPGPHEAKITAVDYAGNNARDLVEFMTGEIASLISKSPEGNKVALDAKIEVVLSKDIKVMDIQIEGINGSLTMNGNKAVYIPISELEPSTRYRVFFSGLDIEGLPLDSYNWTFTTMGLAEIRGTVVDENSNNLRNVQIYANGILITDSGQTGNFFFTMEDGYYKLIFHKEGYENSTLDIHVLMGDEKNLGDVFLEKEKVKDQKEEENDFPVVPVLVLIIMVVLIIFITAILVARRKKSEGDDYTDGTEIRDEGDVGDIIKETPTSYEDLYGSSPAVDYSNNDVSEEDYFTGYSDPPME